MFSRNTPGAALATQKLCSVEKQQFYFFFFSYFLIFYLNFLFLFLEAHGLSLALEAFSSNILVAVLIKGNLYSDRPSQFLKSLRKCLKSQTQNDWPSELTSCLVHLQPGFDTCQHLPLWLHLVTSLSSSLNTYDTTAKGFPQHPRKPRTGSFVTISALQKVCNKKKESLR